MIADYRGHDGTMRFCDDVSDGGYGSAVMVMTPWESGSSPYEQPENWRHYADGTNDPIQHRLLTEALIENIWEKSGEKLE